MTPTIDEESRAMTSVLGEVARQLRHLHEEVHPRELTVSEALALLDILQRITTRLDTDKATPPPASERPILRLVDE
jgi:hypothetical protein